MTHSTRPAPASTDAAAATTRDWLPLAAAAVTMVLWASAFIGIRSVGEHYSPGAMALGRLLVGALALTLFLGHRVRLPRGRGLWLVLAYGALWFGLYNIVLNAAEQDLDAGTAAMLVNLGPILIAVLAGLVLGEGFPRPLVAGLGVAFAGVVVIGIATSTGRFTTLGLVLGLASAVLYAVGVLLQKGALRDVDGPTATWLGCLTGVVVCLPFAPSLIGEVAAAPSSATWGIVYLGVFPTAIAFSTWAYALQRTTAGRLSASSYLVPALAVLMSWLVLSEMPTAVALLGGALCLAGVAVTRLPDRKAVEPTAPVPVACGR